MCAYAVFSDLVMAIKIVCGLYLVKLVNLAFMHVLFRSVYNYDVASNIRVNGLELLASFLCRTRLISSRWSHLGLY